MDDQPARKSHVWAWAISVVAVPVLYLLSVGPVIYYERKQSLTAPYRRPGWIEIYWDSIYWLHENTPLKGPLESYLTWWNELAKSRYSAPHYRASHPSWKPPP